MELRDKPRHGTRLDLTAAERASRYRQRKLNRQRQATEFFLRTLLQKFYESHEIAPTTWVDAIVFLRSPCALDLGLDVLDSLPEIAVEAAVAVTVDGPIKLIRPKYFLSRSS